MPPLTPASSLMCIYPTCYLSLVFLKNAAIVHIWKYLIHDGLYILSRITVMRKFWICRSIARAWGCYRGIIAFRTNCSFLPNKVPFDVILANQSRLSQHNRYSWIMFCGRALLDFASDFVVVKYALLKSIYNRKHYWIPIIQLKVEYHYCNGHRCYIVQIIPFMFTIAMQVWLCILFWIHAIVTSVFPLLSSCHILIHRCLRIDQLGMIDG